MMWEKCNEHYSNVAEDAKLRKCPYAKYRMHHQRSKDLLALNLMPQLVKHLAEPDLGDMSGPDATLAIERLVEHGLEKFLAVGTNLST